MLAIPRDDLVHTTWPGPCTSTSIWLEARTRPACMDMKYMVTTVHTMRRLPPKAAAVAANNWVGLGPC